MKAIELRIGNKVLLSEDSTVFSVSGLHEFGMVCFDDFEETYIEYEQFEGILLTEERLLKFGAEPKEYDGVSCLNGGDYFDLDGVHVVREYLGGMWKLIYKYGEFNYIELEHVHQLQNLYFALKNTELTINTL